MKFRFRIPLREIARVRVGIVPDKRQVTGNVFRGRPDRFRDVRWYADVRSPRNRDQVDVARQTAMHRDRVTVLTRDRPNRRDQPVEQLARLELWQSSTGSDHRHHQLQEIGNR
jgi:hypothetical protein